MSSQFENPAGKLGAIEKRMHMYDKNGDGTYSHTEVKDIVRDLLESQFENENGDLLITAFPKQIQPNLKVFDANGDGTIDMSEFGHAGQLYKDSKDKARRLAIAAAVAFLVIVLLLVAIGIMSSKLIEASKETTTSANGVTTVKGSETPMASAGLIAQSTLEEAFSASDDALDLVKAMRLPGTAAYPTTLSFTVTGWARDTTKVTFFAARGDTIEVTRTKDVTAFSGTTKIWHISMEAGRRRTKSFAGALMTSGSFTTMPASGVNR